MIGVHCEEHERETVREFFELFKTPWEFIRPDRSYSTVICTTGEMPQTDTRLIVVYGSEPRPDDTKLGFSTERVDTDCPGVTIGGDLLPVYRGIAACSGGTALVHCHESRKPAAAGYTGPGFSMIRVGYSLFDEVRFLLTSGQPLRNALIPALEMHIDLLRGWILDAGIPLVEIPPVPDGYGMIASLSHDVDFVRLRHHAFDKSMAGFVYRASVGSLLRALRKDMSWAKARENWGALFRTPLTLLGVYPDPWLQFDRYMELERETSSTFFLIPFNKRRAHPIYPESAVRRTSRYDIDDVLEFLPRLHAQGFEVGVHGLEAWSSRENARREYERLSRHTLENRIGIRMHYLMFDSGTPRALESAGYSYDSTFGYNETPGYRAGTGQAFRFPGTERLIEIPLLIMDTALFSSRRMNLSDEAAWKHCDRILCDMNRFGGVLTVNWHMRSLAPERLWGPFYRRLLSEIHARNAWFGTMADVAAWFRKRREARFSEVRFEPDLTMVGLDTTEDGLPSLSLVLRRRKFPGGPDEVTRRPAVPLTVFPVADTPDTVPGALAHSIAVQ